MIEHKQLLKFAKGSDDYPVMLYMAEIGVVIDWKERSPDEVLYIPEGLFESVGREFIEKIGTERYYGKTVLDDEHIEILCGEREPRNYTDRYISVLEEIRNFIDSGLSKNKSHYLAFEGP